MLDSFIIMFQDIYKKLLLHWISYIHYIYQWIKSPVSCQTSIDLCLDLSLEKLINIFYRSISVGKVNSEFKNFYKNYWISFHSLNLIKNYQKWEILGKKECFQLILRFNDWNWICKYCIFSAFDTISFNIYRLIFDRNYLMGFSRFKSGPKSILVWQLIDDFIDS